MIRTLRPLSQTVLALPDCRPEQPIMKERLSSSLPPPTAAKKDAFPVKENITGNGATTTTTKKSKSKKKNHENKTKNSSNNKKSMIPEIMEWDDIKVGNVLGTGEFGMVLEILSIANCPVQLQPKKEQVNTVAALAAHQQQQQQAGKELLTQCQSTPKTHRLKFSNILGGKKSKPSKRNDGGNDCTRSKAWETEDVIDSTLATQEDISERESPQQQQQPPIRVMQSRRGAALLHHHPAPTSLQLTLPDKALTSLTEVNECFLDESNHEEGDGGEREDDENVLQEQNGDEIDSSNVAVSSTAGGDLQDVNDFGDSHQEQERNEKEVTVKVLFSEETLVAAAAVAAFYDSEQDENEEEEKEKEDDAGGDVNGAASSPLVTSNYSFDSSSSAAPGLSHVEENPNESTPQPQRRRTKTLMRQSKKTRDYMQESSMDFCVLMGLSDSDEDNERDNSEMVHQLQIKNTGQTRATTKTRIFYESEDFVPTVQMNNFESANMKQLRENMDHVRRILCYHTSSRSLSYNFFMDSSFADDAAVDDVLLTGKDAKSSQAITNVGVIGRGVDRHNSNSSKLAPPRQNPYVLKTIQKSLRWDVQLLHARDIVEEAAILTKAGQHENIVSLRATVGRPGSANFGLVLDRVTEILDDTLVAWKEQRRLHHQKQSQQSQSAVAFNPAGNTTTSQPKRNFLLPWRTSSSTNKDNQNNKLSSMASAIAGNDGSASQDGAGSLLTAERVLAMFDVAKALCHLHQHKIVYRDLKPSNIGVDVPTGRVKLFDFGSAVHISDKNKNKNNNNTNSGKHALVDENAELYRLTNQVGTNRCYMAPEVARPNSPYGFQADVYSFAILFWHVMALQVPFEDIRTKEEHLERVVMKQERPPSLLDANTSQANEQLCPDLPYGLDQMMQAAWHDSPIKRPTFLDICQTLQAEFLCQESFQQKNRD